MTDTITNLSGCYDIFPIADDPDVGVGLPARTWMVVVKWYRPGDEYGFPRMLCKCSRCPLRLMRWVYLVALRILQGAKP